MDIDIIRGGVNGWWFYCSQQMRSRSTGLHLKPLPKEQQHSLDYSAARYLVFASVCPLACMLCMVPKHRWYLVQALAPRDGEKGYF